MPSSADHSAVQRAFASPSQATRPSRGFWPSIVRIAALEIVLLLALAGLFVAYLNWSSEASFAEFLAVSKTAPVPTNATEAPCRRGA